MTSVLPDASRASADDLDLASVRAAIRGEVERGPNEAARRAAAARARIAQGLEGDIAALRPPRLMTRVGELAMFGGIWALGGWVAMAGVRASSPLLEVVLRVAGTLVVALALHAIALLL